MCYFCYLCTKLKSWWGNELRFVFLNWKVQQTYIDSVWIFSEESVFDFVELDRVRIESGQVLPLKTFPHQRNTPARNGLEQIQMSQVRIVKVNFSHIYIVIHVFENVSMQVKLLPYINQAVLMKFCCSVSYNLC